MGLNPENLGNLKNIHGWDPPPRDYDLIVLDPCCSKYGPRASSNSIPGGVGGWGLLEVQDFRTNVGPNSSESVFQQEFQIILMHSRVQEALVWE